MLNDQGEVSDFAMNDNYAVETGKFLEVLARALGLSLDEFNTAAVKARASTKGPLRISAMCTVFAVQIRVYASAAKACGQDIANRFGIGRGRLATEALHPSSWLFKA